MIHELVTAIEINAVVNLVIRLIYWSVKLTYLSLTLIYWLITKGLGLLFCPIFSRLAQCGTRSNGEEALKPIQSPNFYLNCRTDTPTHPEDRNIYPVSSHSESCSNSFSTTPNIEISESDTSSNTTLDLKLPSGIIIRIDSKIGDQALLQIINTLRGAASRGGRNAER
jgi:hypothetical protein